MEDQIQRPRQMRHIIQLIRNGSPHLPPQGRQRRILQHPARCFHSFPADKGPGVTVREIGEPAVAHRHPDRKPQDIPDFLILPERHGSACHLFQQGQAVQQRPARHIPVSGTLVASAVLRQHAEIPVQNSAGPLQQLRQLPPWHRGQHGADHNIGKNPWCPVVQILPPDAHPPELVCFHKRQQNPLPDFVPDAPADQR